MVYISDFLFALHKLQDLILFPGDKIFCKRSVVRDNFLHLILISERAAWKLFSMAAFAKGSSNSYVAYKHFVTWRINLIHNILNKFKIELKEYFFSYFFTEISHSCFWRIFIKVYIELASLKRTSFVTLFSSSQ